MPIYNPLGDIKARKASILAQVAGAAAGIASANSDVRTTAIEFISEFASDEGAKLPIAYGEHLVGGTMVVHKFTTGSPNTSIIGVALGEGQGAGGGHGEWESAQAVYYAGEAIAGAFTSATWVEDAIPAGATAVGDTDGWNWVSSNPSPFSGTQAHQSALLSGSHQHYFQGATTTLAVVTGDILYCWVYLDPANPPREVMLQWKEGTSFEHRAYWGENLISYGTDGTDSRRYMGPLPPTGYWYRLAVKASLVGLEGFTLNGMAYTLYDGRATWDQAGKFQLTTGTGAHFYPGLISMGVDDGNQGVDTFLPNGPTYSGTPMLFVNLPSAYTSEDKPERLRARCRTRRVYDFDASGAKIGYGYSSNPALAAADRILAYYETIYPDNKALAWTKFRARINWAYWRQWADYNAALITWDDGTTSNRQILRFECHIAFVDDLSLADALDQICGNCGAIWQDDGEQINFLIPAMRAPVADFNVSNIVVAPKLTRSDPRQRFNWFVAKFRDFDDPYLGPAQVEFKLDTLIDRVGPRKTERNFSNMTRSQAQRILRRQARIESENPVTFTMQTNSAGFHVLPGDFVTVSHPVPGWQYQLCLAIEARLLSAERSADEVAFMLQKIDSPYLYSDSEHTPTQTSLTP
ncbi:MAG TPA: hypothetical protein VJ302_30745 [Blastocatellia bacterium]|nr:hypothetical protein [Blastocatellia bacterium]